MNTLDLQIRRSESYMSFRNSLLKAGCPTAKLNFYFKTTFRNARDGKG